MITLVQGTTRVLVDPVAGGRLVGLAVGGRQLLMPAPPDSTPAHGGCYPMVPWAGRIRYGRFSLLGRDVQLEIDAPPHALHGLAYRRPWRVTSADADRCGLAIDLSTPEVAAAGWPFGGTVTQAIRATADGVALAMTITAGEGALPLTFGWHPWFVRHLAGVEGQAVVDAGAMYARDAEGLPTGALIDVPPGPWDDCMTDLRATPGVRWPGVGRVEVRSDLDHLVVFDQHPTGICIEPQSGPPDAVNLPSPAILEGGGTVQGWAELRFVPGGLSPR
ncbi:aldose 1-epimerase [soil metagenome]